MNHFLVIVANLQLYAYHLVNALSGTDWSIVVEIAGALVALVVSVFGGVNKLTAVIKDKLGLSGAYAFVAHNVVVVIFCVLVLIAEGTITPGMLTWSNLSEIVWLVLSATTARYHVVKDHA